MQNNTQYIQEDDINLRGLWVAFVKRKMTIFAVTAITTLVAAIYVWTAKPVYSGEVVIEIGKVILNSDPINDKPTIIQPIENSGDLQAVIEQTFNTNNKEEKIKIDSPKGSIQLIRISYEHTDKQVIRKKLAETTAFILNRHQHSAEFFQKANGKIISSNIIDTIGITSDPIKPKKMLIIAVGFMSGLMFGIFLAFFREFNTNGRKVDETPEMNKE